MVVRSRIPERIHVRLGGHASARQQHELGAFARYCIRRVERELGEHDAWTVDVGPSAGGFTSRIVARRRAVVVEAEGIGYDAVLAIWEAMCALEQRLREPRT